MTNQENRSSPLAAIIWASYPGIALAGGIYSAFVLMINVLTPYTVDAVTKNWITNADLILLIYWLLVGTFIGVIVASVVGFIALTIFSLLNWSLGFIVHPITTAGIAGGFTGYAMAYFILYSSHGFSSFLEWIQAIAIGPITAMICCEYFARKFSRSGVKKIRRKQFGGQLGAVVARTQFQLPHLFILTMWAGCALEAARFFGFLDIRLLFFLGAYIIFQLVIELIWWRVSHIRSGGSLTADL